MHKIMNSACNVDYKIQNQLNTYREGTGEVNYRAPLKAGSVFADMGRHPRELVKWKSGLQYYATEQPHLFYLHLFIPTHVKC